MQKRSFYIYSNPFKPECGIAAGRIAQRLLAGGAEVLADTWLAQEIPQARIVPIAELPQGTEAVISLGGDGTLLRTVPYAARLSVPLLGVNLGHVGFLLESDPNGLDAAMDALLCKNYVPEERSLLLCDTGSGETVLALNDVVVSRGEHPGMITVRAYASDELIFSGKGDGVIVSTPTGTTGYALSAGGPVIHPAVPCILVMPICSHVMHQRPVVLPCDNEIRLEADVPPNQRLQLIVDGQNIWPFESDKSILIRMAKEKARFIRFEPQHFLTRLREKQAEWGRE